MNKLLVGLIGNTVLRPAYACSLKRHLGLLKQLDHNRLQETTERAAEINQSQDLASITVGLQDEILQSDKPVLVGVDAASTYCYLLKSVDHRDEDTWGYHLLDVIDQGFEPDYTITDGGSGLRAGQKEVIPEVSCHGDVFHIQQQF